MSWPKTSCLRIVAKFCFSGLLAWLGSVAFAAGGRVQDAKAVAQEILSRPVYRDPGVSERPNWLAGLFDALGRAIGNWLEKLFDWLGKLLSRTPRGSAPSLNWLQPLVIAILGLLLAVFVFFMVRHFAWSARRRKRAGGLMDEEEPDRTADEWLVRADELSSQGKFREAVRCLYLACLVRFDDARVARFVRTETNWEHLERIQASPRRPAGVDFLAPTRRFDVIWYGFRTEGMPDVEWFRNQYEELCRVLSLRAA